MSVYINDTIMYATPRRPLSVDTSRRGSVLENCIRSRPERPTGRFDCAAQAALASRYSSATTCNGQVTAEHSILPASSRDSAIAPCTQYGRLPASTRRSSKQCRRGSFFDHVRHLLRILRTDNDTLSVHNN